MKLIEIKLQAPRGTFFGVRPTKETIEAMQDFMKSYDIPNPVDPDDMHTTVVYSRVFCGARPLGKLLPTWKGKFSQYNMFPRSVNVNEGEDFPMCLVMEFHCPDLHKRHHELRTKHGATHDFPDYSPHMTLSYNPEDFDHQGLPEYAGPHEFDTEYSEPLDTKRYL